ncbi:hypothetical protein [Salinicoccus sp. Marseille-QA3877]
MFTGTIDSIVVSPRDIMQFAYLIMQVRLHLSITTRVVRRA